MVESMPRASNIQSNWHSVFLLVLVPVFVPFSALLA
jgi:hypothetical protein